MKLITSEAEARQERDAAIAAAHQKYEKRLADIKAAQTQHETRVASMLADAESALRTKKPKHLIAWELRQEGLAFKEIGSRLGVGAQRASQLVDNHNRYLSRLASNPFGTLSTRAINILWCNGLDISAPEKIAAIGVKNLMKLPNSGKKSVTEIVFWLKERGFEIAP